MINLIETEEGYSINALTITSATCEKHDDHYLAIFTTENGDKYTRKFSRIEDYRNLMDIAGLKHNEM